MILSFVLLGVVLLEALVVVLIARRARAADSEIEWLRTRLRDDEGETARRDVARRLREQAVIEAGEGLCSAAKAYLAEADEILRA